MRNVEIKSEIDKIKKWGNKIKQKYLKYETDKCIYGFQQYLKKTF